MRCLIFLLMHGLLRSMEVCVFIITRVVSVFSTFRKKEISMSKEKNRDDSPVRYAPDWLGGFKLVKCTKCKQRAFAESNTYFLNVHGCRIDGCTNSYCEECADTEWFQCCVCKIYGVCDTCKLDGKHCPHPSLDNPGEIIKLTCHMCDKVETREKATVCPSCVRWKKWECNGCFGSDTDRNMKKCSGCQRLICKKHRFTREDGKIFCF